MFKKFNKSSLAIGFIIALIGNIILLVSLFSLQSQYDNDIRKFEQIEKKNKSLYAERDRLNIALSKFEVNKQYLMSIGATENQANIALKASKLYNIDPKY